jgi:hypothetical protein
MGNKMNKKIIWANDAGLMMITTPAPAFVASLLNDNPDWDEERALKHIADKDLASGTRYSIMTEEEISTVLDTDGDGIVDRTFRDAWEYTAPADALTSNDLSEEDLTKYGMTGQAE